MTPRCARSSHCAEVHLAGTTSSSGCSTKGVTRRRASSGRMPVREYFPGEKLYHMVYCEDPFGNILEVYSHSYELTYSAGAYA
ncbi:hypothetical protein [Novosphingobium profundi]|uniref:hypothetical protein n=1 Tax=Novosphingobium profundi TaxID=1774954 RepID=UPI001BDB5B68|nr:hypothetical protein [Novosphingobium profundi]